MILQKYLWSTSLLLGTLLILQSPRTLSADDLDQGERLFQLHCAPCHGLKGEGGRGPTLAVPQLRRAPTGALLIKVIRDGIPGTEMPRLRLDEEQIRQLAIWVRKLGQLPPEQISGNAQQGEQLYFTKGDCARCHAIKGQGGALGPDLTDVGRRRSARYLRTALTDPEADVPKSFSLFRSGVSIPENFLQVRVLTKDGRRISGVRLNEDTFSIQVRDSSDHIYSFLKSELVELQKDWGKSPMPSYRDSFAKTELDDVVAFLISLQGEE
jgi:cytochrome c oxidase cbb3-type subunit 3